MEHEGHLAIHNFPTNLGGSQLRTGGGSFNFDQKIVSRFVPLLGQVGCENFPLKAILLSD